MSNLKFPATDADTQNVMTRKEYRALLKAHDWFYPMSDDPRAYNRGREEAHELQHWAKSSPDLQADYDAAGDYIFSGPSFGKPEAPKPEWM